LDFTDAQKKQQQGVKAKYSKKKNRDFLLETFQRMTDNLKYNDETAEQYDNELSKFETCQLEPEDIQRQRVRGDHQHFSTPGIAGFTSPSGLIKNHNQGVSPPK